MPGTCIILCIYALPKQNKLNRKRHRHCHGMHGQYTCNLPESRIFRFSIPANAGAWTPLGGLSSPQTPGAIGYPLSFTNYLLQQKKTRTMLYSFPPYVWWFIQVHFIYMSSMLLSPLLFFYCCGYYWYLNCFLFVLLVIVLSRFYDFYLVVNYHSFST